MTPATRSNGKAAGSKWTLKADEAYDRAHAIKEGSAKDNALDRKRGVPVKKGKR